MRILHIANFSWFPSLRKRMDNWMHYYASDYKITNGLIRNGHSVWSFSYRDLARYLSPLMRAKKLGAAAMNAAIIRATRLFQPHLLLLGHSELITATTLVALRNMLPNCKIAQWWVDPFFTSPSLQHLLDKQQYLDAFFATTSPSYYAPLIAGKNSPPLFYMPNIVDSSIETERSFSKEKQNYDIFFAGSDSVERAKVLTQIQTLTGVRCGFFGFGGRPSLNGSALSNIIGNSKIGLNLSRPGAINAPLYSSDRISQLVGNGCLVLTPRTPQMTTLFTENEVAYYDNTEELLSHIQKHCTDDTAWRKIAKAGWRRAHHSYNECRVTKFIVEATMGRDFSEQYEWLFATVSAKISKSKIP